MIRVESGKRRVGIAALVVSLALSGCSEPRGEAPELSWIGVTQQEGSLVLLTSFCSSKPIVKVQLLEEDTKQVLWQIQLDKRLMGLPDTQQPNINRFVAGEAPQHFEETVAFSDTGDRKLLFQGIWTDAGGVGPLVGDIRFKHSDLRPGRVAVYDGRPEFFYVTKREFEQHRKETCASLGSKN